jgi:hypothetical protein
MPGLNGQARDLAQEAPFRNRKKRSKKTFLFASEDKALRLWLMDQGRQRAETEEA